RRLKTAEKLRPQRIVPETISVRILPELIGRILFVYLAAIFPVPVAVRAPGLAAHRTYRLRCLVTHATKCAANCRPLTRIPARRAVLAAPRFTANHLHIITQSVAVVVKRAALIRKRMIQI